MSTEEGIGYCRRKVSMVRGQIENIGEVSPCFVSKPCSCVAVWLLIHRHLLTDVLEFAYNCVAIW